MKKYWCNHCCAFVDESEAKPVVNGPMLHQGCGGLCELRETAEPIERTKPPRPCPDCRFIVAALDQKLARAATVQGIADEHIKLLEGALYGDSSKALACDRLRESLQAALDKVSAMMVALGIAETEGRDLITIVDIKACDHCKNIDQDLFKKSDFEWKDQCVECGEDAIEATAIIVRKA